MYSSNRLRTVFVGNISYEGTEEELRELFSQVGPIANLRLVVDRDTGKRKGFGFIEFFDQESALSAVRNLNEIDFHGRPLRVNIAEQDTKGPQPSDGLTLQASNSKKRKEVVGGGPPDAGADTPVSLGPVDPLSRFIEQYERRALFSAVAGAKRFLLTRPAEAEQLFAQQPALVRGLNFAIDLLCGQHWPSPEELEAAAVSAPNTTAVALEASTDKNLAKSGSPGDAASADATVKERPPGSVNLPGMGYIVPGPQHAPLLEQVLRLGAAQINALPEVGRAQMLELQRQLREQLAAGRLAHLGITLVLEDLPPAIEGEALPIKAEN